jgi:hypothetical protein
MAVLPINTKIRGPAPISCKSQTEGRSYSLDRRTKMLGDHGSILSQGSGRESWEGEIELRDEGGGDGTSS